MPGTAALRALLPSLALALPASAEDVKRAFAGEVGDLVLVAMAEYNALTELPLPELEPEGMADLLAGEVVRLRWKQPVPGEETAPGEEPKERHRVVALYLIEEPRLHVWLSAMDEHTVASKSVTEVRIFQNNDGSGRWYQFMDLPWPVENRHWVIDVFKNRALGEATEGRVWEGTWQLVPDGLARAMELVEKGEAGGVDPGDARSAVYLEANVGAWAMIDLAPELTLLAYQVTVVLGGLLPEGLTARFAMRELESLCHTVEENCARFPEHYDAAHTPIYGGDGAVVPPASP